mmetsp:Transcript_53076/g.106581  ORF Transcript_53076/g.106581 Transcript_53076/m.106581 type:complete len:265 (-) Transcript_53076:69-863(-)
MLGLKADDAARAWVPVAAITLVAGGLVGAIVFNRAHKNPISCSHPSLPLITAVLENGTERLAALCALLIAMPFNMAFSLGAWAVWRRLDGAAASTACSDRAGPCACALGGWVLVGLVALNNRELDPRHALHNAMVGGFVLCEAIFLACSMRSLTYRMRLGFCPKCLVSAKAQILALRWAVVAVGAIGVVAFCALSLASAMSGSCEAYRRTSLYAAFAEYAAVFSLVVQYAEHAYEFHLLRSSGIWAASAEATELQAAPESSRHP